MTAERQRSIVLGALSIWLALASAARATAQDEGASEDPARDAEPESELEQRIAALEARLAELEHRDLAAHEAARDATDEGDAAARPTEDVEAPAPFTLGGWVEAYWAWSFAEPSNGIIDLRGFDNRHNSFNLSNVVLDAHWDHEGVNGRVTLQWGSTPATYYLAETAAPSLGSGVGAQSQSLWQFVQQAYVGYRVPIGAGLDVQAGLFLSPIGPEGMSVKDNWLYSRSNLFYGFPFYHTGIRLSYPVLPELTISAWVINGWNTVLDNNDEKTIVVAANLALPDVAVGFSYVSGVERLPGAPEGRAWRHTFDLNATLTPLDWLGVQGQVTGGFEPNDLGTSGYLAGALSVRVAPLEWLAISARGDFFWEHLGSGAAGTASPIFWPVEWVSGTTASVELRPHDQISLRIEYRHDEAAGPAYFRGAVASDPATGNSVRSSTTQDTLTIGTTAWF